MLFNSLQFLLFFPVVTLGYFLLPMRWRWLWLLSASCYFYMALIPKYLLILAFTIGVDYAAALLIERSTGRRRKLCLAASIAANLGVLFLFKYLDFFQSNLSGALGLLGYSWAGAPLKLLLPVGLSFHTFQAMSYTIEVYRGAVKAERHLGIFALYVMFFPQLVAGPIERPQNLLWQFRETHVWDRSRAWEGFCLMLWGFFKKVVVADRLAVIANQFFGHSHDYGAAAAWIAVYAFAFQIYCDFSGYSDIARGSAKVLGYDLMVNFDRPYFASTISDFWRRWHISLSTWFRDYLYIPLGGSRAGRVRTVVNLAAVFLISGLWHGANWTFVAWGACHAVLLIAENLLGEGRPGRWVLPRTLLTFQLVALSWVFFRAESFAQALDILRLLFQGWSLPVDLRGFFATVNLGLGGVELWIAAWSVLLLLGIEASAARGPWIPFFARRPLLVRVGFVYAAVAVIAAFGRFDSAAFIYFQF